MTETPAKIFRSYTTIRHLVDTYNRHVLKGSARGRDGVPPASLADDIREVCRGISFRLRSGTYEFTQYREQLISKGAGKTPRVISIPTSRDRIALRALADCLAHIYPNCRGVVPQVRIGQVHEALSTELYDAYVRIDVSEFYPSIRHTSVRRKLADRIQKPEIIDAALQAVRTPTVPDGTKKRPWENRGVPQGLSISNVLAELVASSVDDQMSEEDDDWRYFRFVDDVLILCRSDQANELFKRASDLFQREGLSVHSLNTGGKSSIGKIADGFDFLGYIFTSRTISARPSSIRRVESSLARSFTRYKRTDPMSSLQPSAVSRCQWYVNLTITGCIYKGVAHGWLHYFRQMDDLILLKKLDATVHRFQQRFQMPPDFRPKSFMRAYWSIRHPNSRTTAYIPNYDHLTIKETRDALASILGEAIVVKMSDFEVIRRFNSTLEEAVSDLEKDEGALS